MNTIPNALDKAKEVVKNNPAIFSDNEATVNEIAIAMIDYAQACNKIYREEIKKIMKPDPIPEVFTDIFKQFNFQK